MNQDNHTNTSIRKYQVTVLIEAVGARVQDYLNEQNFPEELREDLEMTQDLAAIGRAVTALATNLELNEALYAQHAIKSIAVELLPAQQGEPASGILWCEALGSGDDVLEKIAERNTQSLRVRQAVPSLPAEAFFPLEGAFFSAPDEAPQVSSQVAALAAAYPDRFALVDLALTVVAAGDLGR